MFYPLNVFLEEKVDFIIFPGLRVTNIKDDQKCNKISEKLITRMNLYDIGELQKDLKIDLEGLDLRSIEQVQNHIVSTMFILEIDENLLPKTNRIVMENRFVQLFRFCNYVLRNDYKFKGFKANAMFEVHEGFQMELNIDYHYGSKEILRKSFANRNDENYIKDFYSLISKYKANSKLITNDDFLTLVELLGLFSRDITIKLKIVLGCMIIESMIGYKQKSQSEETTTKQFVYGTTYLMSLYDNEIDLDFYKKLIDDLYSIRSNIVHGSSNMGKLRPSVYKVLKEHSYVDIVSNKPNNYYIAYSLINQLLEVLVNSYYVNYSVINNIKKCHKSYEKIYDQLLVLK